MQVKFQKISCNTRDMFIKIFRAFYPIITYSCVTKSFDTSIGSLCNNRIEIRSLFRLKSEKCFRSNSYGAQVESDGVCTDVNPYLEIICARVYVREKDLRVFESLNETAREK